MRRLYLVYYSKLATDQVILKVPVNDQYLAQTPVTDQRHMFFFWSQTNMRKYASNARMFW